jgi:hypothetical protein
MDKAENPGHRGPHSESGWIVVLADRCYDFDRQIRQSLQDSPDQLVITVKDVLNVTQTSGALTALSHSPETQGRPGPSTAGLEPARSLTHEGILGRP